GALVDFLCSITFTNCSFTGNLADNTTAPLLTGGGGIWNAGSLTVTASSFVQNTANNSLSGGGGILTLGNLLATNTTFEGNAANNCILAGGGAVAQDGGVAVLVSSTLVNNTADGSFGGGGIFTPGSTFEIYDTIVAGNTSSGVASDVSLGLSALSSYNLIGTGGAGGLQNGVNGNLVGVANPGLGTIGNNGGFTQTIPLLAGSPAIDAGSASISGVTVSAIDQRGAQRGPAGLDSGAAFDIGAYEASSSYLVNSSADDGTLGTLRCGLAWAGTSTNSLAPAGTANLVRFDTSPAGTFAAPKTITLSLGPLEIPGNGSSSALVQGPGATALTITSNNAYRVVTVDATAIATLADLTITGGTDSGFGGGGINTSGNLTLSGVAVVNNTASNTTFGVGGGIFSTGTLSLLDSTISGNSATGLGGGGILNSGTAMIVDCTLADNTAVNGFYGGGAILNSGSMTIVSSTIADNTINGGAQGSTPQGGGLDQVASGTASLYDTIIASNSDLTTGSPVASDIGGTVNSASAYSVIGTGGSGGLINGVNHSLVGVVTPGLGALGYYGGLTQTLPLLFGSAAFDTGSATISGVTVPVFDQRGALRGPAGLDAGTTIDIGSYEASSSALVTSPVDNANLSGLRAALAWANGSTNAYAPAGTPNTILFDASPSGPFSQPQTITLSLGPLVLSNTSNPVSITGPGASLLTISGNNSVEVFDVNQNVTAALSDLTIANGSSTATGGGGIGNFGTLTVTACSIASNKATGFSVGGGGLYNFGTLTLLNSTVANNTSSGTQGGGGGIVSTGTLSLFNTTVANNSSANDTYGGGGILSFGTATLINSTIADNDVINGTGGGLSVPSGTATLDNAIVALNVSINGGLPVADDVAGTLASTSQFNLIGTGGSGGLTDGVNGNKVGVADPGLGTLAKNGGPTQTMALLPGSPAIDAGSNALAIGPDGNPLSTDQRGPGFARISAGTVDIGAYELQQVATIASVSVSWGSADSSTLQTAADGLRLLPAGRKTDLPWAGINRIQITLDFAATLLPGDVSVTGVSNYGPVTIAGSGSTYTITLAKSINAADRVTITISNSQIQSYTRRLDVLPGDVNDDGVVNSQDAVLVRNMFLGITPPTLFGDINGDGVVNLSDFIAVRKFIGSKLPPLS
ncbi:MAG TPA: dockerin type I repeat-containing protein, partial [Isosphaeraceae bacterium]|nr:dockerin type I repeat-containing protein [Isosphaeraceae bacterium]